MRELRYFGQQRITVGVWLATAHLNAAIKHISRKKITYRR